MAGFVRARGSDGPWRLSCASAIWVHTPHQTASVATLFQAGQVVCANSMQQFVQARSGERAPVDLPDNGMD